MPSLSQIWEKVRQHPLMVALFALRWAITLGAAAFSLAYIGYKEHSNISAQVTADFKVLADEQEDLLVQLTTLLPNLLDPNVVVDLDGELEATKNLSQDVLIALGQFRAPTSRIDDARVSYRQSLERVIGVTNRIQREGVDGMAVDLHNSLQQAVNDAGNFLTAVQDFQGGAWSQVFGSLI